MKQSRIEAIISQCLLGDARAFSMLVDEYQYMVFRLAFRLVCDEEEARDVVQETFIKVWQSLHRYDKRYRFSTWLYKIAVNASYDRLRVLQHSPGSVLSKADISGLHILSGEDVEKDIINRELKEVITILTAELPPMQRLVFTLSELEELDTEDIKVITGLSVVKIKGNLYLARKKIRERIMKLNIEL